MDSFPPALIMFGGAIVVPFLPGAVRPWAFLVSPIIVLTQLLVWLEPGDLWAVEYLTFSLTPLLIDDLNEVWATTFALIAIGGGVFALHLRADSLRERGQQAAALAYVGSAFGVIFAGDMLSLIVFWELMAVTSFYLIISGDRTNSLLAARRYLFIHVVGGSALLGGILVQAVETGSLAVQLFDGGVGSWLAMFGILVNAASFPLHAWLSDAYPESSPTGMVFLGALTTKTAVYVLLRTFPGEDILLAAGGVTAVYAGIYALFHNDIRRILAYHIISQVGFMVAAVGVGTHAGVESAADQVFTHVIWQAVMVMGAGAIMHATGTTKLTELGGLRSQLRSVLLLYMVGAVSISAFPLLMGLGTNTIYDDHMWVSVLLTIASIATVIAVAIKLPYYAFVASNTNLPTAVPVPSGMLVAMGVGAVLSLWVGIHPSSLFDVLQLHLETETYHLGPALFGIGVLAASAVLGWLILQLLRPHDTASIDIDWVYRNAETPIRMLVQVPLEWVFATTQGASSWLTATATHLALMPPFRGPNLVGQPPLSAAIAIIFLTFAVGILLTEMF